MSVYVDDMNADYRRMQMSHLMADTTEELLAMVDKIGVPRKWIQKAETPGEHFDICLSKKVLALRYGAIQVTWRELGIWQMLRRRWWPLHITFKEAHKRYDAETQEIVDRVENSHRGLRSQP